MPEFATSPPSGEDDAEDTRVLTVADVLNALDALKGEVGGHAAAVAEMLAQQEAAKTARYEARQDLLRRLTDEPHRFGFFAAVRLLENAHPGLPRVGTSLRLRDDPIRFAQSPSLSFARARPPRSPPSSTRAAGTARRSFRKAATPDSSAARFPTRAAPRSSSRRRA